MFGTSISSCQYQNWWDRRTSQASRKIVRYASDGAILLPMPSFPPPLEFDPNQFALPPPYHEVVDLEKAVYAVQQRHSHFCGASTTCSYPTCAHHFREETKATQDRFRLPIRRHVRLFQRLRHTIFTVYRRIFTIVFVLNLVGLVILLRQDQFRHERLTCETLAALASSNFLLAILVRQDYLVNLLFRTAWLVPWSIPLGIRKIAARVYCYGGLHSGGAVAGTVWWVALTVNMSWTLLKVYTTTMIIVAWTLLLLLVVILILSYPAMRAKFHNTFEMTHRFLGWISIILFWSQLLLLSQHTTSPHRSLSQALIHNPTFWNLIIITALLIYPWLRLRRWTFTAQLLSSHAIRLSFPNDIHKFSCLSISSSPLREWHPFATFPSINPGFPGGSMVISNAGDWTQHVIQTTQRNKAEGGVRMQFYVKSHPKAGVLSLSLLFPRVLILTTGSGIGPALSSLLDRPAAQHARLVWSTRSPLATYGAEILDLVHKADPDAVVLDTDEMGRPNLLEVAWRMYKEERAEAVFVLSNEKVVTWVVGSLERRGVPAFGPIWDS